MSVLDGVVEVVSKGLRKVFGSRNERLLTEMQPVVDQVNVFEEDLRSLSDDQLLAKTAEFRQRLSDGEPAQEILPEAFAVVRETADRYIGIRNVFDAQHGFDPASLSSREHLRTFEERPDPVPVAFYEEIRRLYPESRPPFRMRIFDVQLIGGMVLYHGKIAEMATGEGKTLVATLAAYMAAVEGLPVHIVTVNDYLARRDMEWMGPVYEKLGLSVGVIQSNMDHHERQQAYGCDITYGTNNEFGFDYLRDNMKPSKSIQVQGRLGFAIVDEVDSILVDEARTPLIISGPAEESSGKYFEADIIARRLKEGPDFEIKLKEQSVLLTEEGMERAEEMAGVGSFYVAKNMDWPHLIDQALRARNFFKLDADYIVKDGEVLIVDEFTGRLMPGRRWSDGLHQAIEAKEKLKIKEENQTLATITLQNYFKLYDRLAGMTGTAATEAEELWKIYSLDVVIIPTNRPLLRTNHPDVIYLTEKEKFNAIIDEICSVHRTGRPILVGTISIEKSEQLGDALRKRGVDHEVLNAKQHEREAQIITKAGQLGNVTIATNMAGRGTDIVLGEFELAGLFEFWKTFDLLPDQIDASWPVERIEEALWRKWVEKELPSDEGEDSDGLEKLKNRLSEHWEFTRQEPLRFGTSVAKLGGLHIVGTERHEARRIDNQLRGRSGRQGDPGSSRFYLALDDDLMKRFASEWVSSMLEKLGMTEGQEIEHGMVSKSIERAQKKVEQFNFDIRKHLLEYDEVMNEQRKLIYGQRQQMLEGKDQREVVVGMIRDSAEAAVEVYVNNEAPPEGHDYDGLGDWLRTRLGVTVGETDLRGAEVKELPGFVADEVEKAYERREKDVGEERMRDFERFVLLQTIDTKWKDHLYDMDYLKSGIGLRGWGQVDPKMEYKKEGYEMFANMLTGIGTEVTDFIFKIHPEPDNVGRSIWRVANEGREEVVHVFDDAIDPSTPELREPIIRDEPKVGRNNPCVCGSGRKFKHCCGKT